MREIKRCSDERLVVMITLTPGLADWGFLTAKEQEIVHFGVQRCLPRKPKVEMNPKLVGGLNPSEKSIGMIIPNIWENKKCSKPPTSKSQDAWHIVGFLSGSSWDPHFSRCRQRVESTAPLSMRSHAGGARLIPGCSSQIHHQPTAPLHQSCWGMLGVFWPFLVGFKNGGFPFPNLCYTPYVWLLSWKIPENKWMMTGGAPISGHRHINPISILYLCILVATRPKNHQRSTLGPTGQLANFKSRCWPFSVSPSSPAGQDFAGHPAKTPAHHIVGTSTNNVGLPSKDLWDTMEICGYHPTHPSYSPRNPARHTSSLAASYKSPLHQLVSQDIHHQPPRRSKMKDPPLDAKPRTDFGPETLDHTFLW